MCSNDDDIYEQFRAKFPHMRVDRIDEDAMKSLEGKELWRPFLMSLETLVVDYNFATLLRLDSRRDYSPENTTVGTCSEHGRECFATHELLCCCCCCCCDGWRMTHGLVPRAQFYCIEIARNREGANTRT